MIDQTRVPTARRHRRGPLAVLARALATSALTIGAALAQLAAPPTPSIPVVPGQFSAVGFIENMVLDTNGTVCQPTHPSLAGGTITVNGQIIVVPCNTILQMPATSLTFAELFSLAPLGTPPGTTGLALADPIATKTGINAALPSYEVRVEGNVISGQYIAGLIFISQQSLNANRGMVSHIDYANGVIHVGGIPNQPAATDTRIRINDPVGRFGKSHGAAGSGAAIIEPDFDPRFTADTNNPTIRSVTGFPMCIPRSSPYGAGAVEDPLCPTRNRPVAPNCASLPATAGFAPFAATPAGEYCRAFAMALPPAVITAALPPCVNGACNTDPTRQAPIMVGDSITFNGTLKIDPLTGPYLSAHTVIADVGIYTQPGSHPSYVVIDEMLQGMNAAPVAGLAQETTPELRIEGFSTDPSSMVDIYTVEFDPKTGLPNYRLQGTTPPTVGVLGRFRMRLPAGFQGGPTREMLVVSRTLCGSNFVLCLPAPTSPLFANGLLAGTYQAPVYEYIWPENLSVGGATVPANLQDLSFLYCGSGPLKTPSIPDGTLGPVVGQLKPAPWALPMPTPTFAAALCPDAPAIQAPVAAFLPPPQLVVNTTPVSAPTASAGVVQTVNGGTPVILSASASADTNSPARTLSFQWTQISGPVVTLTNANAANASFTAPILTSVTTLQFRVTVSNGVKTATADTSVTVNPPPAPVVTVANANITVVSRSPVTMSAVSSPVTGVTYAWTQTSGATITLSGANTATANFTAPVGPALFGFQVKVTNTGNGLSTTVPVTVNVVGDVVQVPTATWSAKSGKVTVVATSSVPAAPTALTATVLNGTTTLVAQTAMTARAAGTTQCAVVPGQPCWTLGPVNMTRPTATTTVRVVSNRGGQAVVPVTVVP